MRNKNGFVVPLIAATVILILALVAGAFWLGQKSTSPGSSPTPSPTQVTGTTQQTYRTPEESQWETYTNNSLGFSIKHPSLSVEESKNHPASNDAIFTIEKDQNKLSEIIQISVSTVPAGTQIKQAIENGYSTVGMYSTEEIKFEEVSIDGVKGLYSTDGVPAREYAYDAFVIKGNKLFSFRLSGASDIYVPLFKEMLSTFKFIQ